MCHSQKGFIQRENINELEECKKPIVGGMMTYSKNIAHPRHIDQLFKHYRQAGGENDYISDLLTAQSLHKRL